LVPFDEVRRVPFSPTETKRKLKDGSFSEIVEFVVCSSFAFAFSVSSASFEKSSYQALMSSLYQYAPLL